MKKFWAALAVVLSVCCVVPFVGCKKNKTEKSKTFSKYFSQVTARDESYATYETEKFFENPADAYRSLTFVGDEAWTEDLKARKIEFFVVANKTQTVDIDIIIFTNSKSITENRTIEFVEGETTKITLDVDLTFVGDTRITLSIALVGGSSRYDGVLFDKDNNPTGFKWTTTKATLFANH